MSHACQRFWNCYKTLTFCSLLTRCTIPCACHAKRHLNLQKWFEHVFLNILTCKRTSRRNGVHFFIISTSKSGPNIVCFVHFDLEMSLAPQRRATFYLSSLRTRRFSEPTFWPSGATNHWKNTVFRDFATFSRTCIFFPLTLSLLWSSLFCSSLLWLFQPLLFHLSILSEVWLLNFLLCPIMSQLGISSVGWYWLVGSECLLLKRSKPKLLLPKPTFWLIKSLFWLVWFCWIINPNFLTVKSTLLASTSTVWRKKIQLVGSQIHAFLESIPTLCWWSETSCQ